jgi:hypothetical protein
VPAGFTERSRKRPIEIVYGAGLVRSWRGLFVSHRCNGLQLTLAVGAEGAGCFGHLAQKSPPDSNRQRHAILSISRNRHSATALPSGGAQYCLLHAICISAILLVGWKELHEHHQVR